ncbi:putative carboxylesterase [Abeliophyllum distichum]|uniref:Carboxylesterase n=1 Tax=Abeliophyllum distichum TaxID=126358 RepID=A0ABD1P8M2_9LAMI
MLKDSRSTDILYDIYPFVQVYKDGRIERFIGTDRVPATTGVESKDIKIAPKRNVSARVYVRNRHAIPFGRKLPLLIYFHGGGFVTESVFSPTYHTFLNALVDEANIIAVSIEYRLAPEHLLPIAYEDSWLALNWVVSHYEGNENEMWLNKHADFGNVYLRGDSAGANIAHNMAMRVGLASPEYPIKFSRVFLICPYFLGKRPIGNEAADPIRRNLFQSLWIHSYPNSRGLGDPLVNPAVDPKLSRLGCTSMLIFVAGKDFLRDREWFTLSHC